MNVSLEPILLAGMSVRAIAESAVRAGYRVIALDYFGDRDLRGLCPGISLTRDLAQPYAPEQLAAAARDLPAASVAYVASLENHPDVVAELARGRRLLGNPPEVLRRVRDPQALERAVRDMGTLREPPRPTPRTLPPGRLAPDGHVRWLRKPLRSGGGHAITWWRPGQEVDTRHYLQEYIPGPACSAAFVADGRRAVVLGLSRQLIGRRAFGAAGFRYCGNLLPLPLPPPESAALLAQVRDLVVHLTRVFELRGVNGLDFVLHSGQVYPLEVNPRFSASLELAERAYGLPIFDLHARACAGDLPSFEVERARPRGGYHAKAIVFARRDIATGDTAGWAAEDLRDVPHTGERIERGHPVCTIFAGAPTWTTCYRRLVRRAREVERRLEIGD